MRIPILHLIDTLDAGGAQRMAVALVNGLDRRRFLPYLCASRRGGALRSSVKTDVDYLCLSRRTSVDVSAFLVLISWIRRNGIKIIHAHSTSLFLAAMAAMMVKDVRVIWHDHSGKGTSRNPWLYRLAMSKVELVVAVTPELARWAIRRANARNAVYIRNFVEPPPKARTPMLPGAPDSRIVCVANFRPEKDLLTLLSAMRIIASHNSSASLLLVGQALDAEYAAEVRDMIQKLNLGSRVFVLGSSRNVSALLSQCAIGVLSSRVEGLPLALLEYGQAGLAVVTTNVGQCHEVLDNETTGFLVEPGDFVRLAECVLRLLDDASLRSRLATALQRRVAGQYSAAAVLPELEALYRRVLGIEPLAHRAGVAPA